MSFLRFPIITILLLVTAPVLAGDKTPLMKAARQGDTQAVKALIEQGADVNERSKKKKQTALMQAAKADSAKVIDLLVKAGAKVDMGNKNNGTALNFAGKFGANNAVQRLIFYGADPEHKNKSGKTPAEQASNRGHNSTNRLIRELAKYRKFDVAISLPGGADAKTRTRQAMRNALAFRRWQVESEDDTGLVATYLRKDRVFKIRVDWKADLIILNFIRGYSSPNPSYLNNLKQDMERAMGA